MVYIYEGEPGLLIWSHGGCDDTSPLPASGQKKRGLLYFIKENRPTESSYLAKMHCNSKTREGCKACW